MGAGGGGDQLDCTRPDLIFCPNEKEHKDWMMMMMAWHESKFERWCLENGDAVRPLIQCSFFLVVQ